MISYEDAQKTAQNEIKEIQDRIIDRNTDFFTVDFIKEQIYKAVLNYPTLHKPFSIAIITFDSSISDKQKSITHIISENLSNSVIIAFNGNNRVIVFFPGKILDSIEIFIDLVEEKLNNDDIKTDIRLFEYLGDITTFNEIETCL